MSTAKWILVLWTFFVRVAHTTRSMSCQLKIEGSTAPGLNRPSFYFNYYSLHWENCERAQKVQWDQFFYTRFPIACDLSLTVFFCCCLRCFCVGCLKLYRLHYQSRSRSSTFPLLTRWRRIVLSYLLADADVSCASARSINITWLRFVFCRDKMFPYLDNSNSFSPMVGTDV